MKSDKVISASGREFNLKLLEEDLDWAVKLIWTESLGELMDVLVDMNGRSTRLYIGQTFDEKKIELVKNGWTHDHCDICSNDIRAKDSCAISDNQIICKNCYDDFIIDKNWLHQNI